VCITTRTRLDRRRSIIGGDAHRGGERRHATRVMAR